MSWSQVEAKQAVDMSGGNVITQTVALTNAVAVGDTLVGWCGMGTGTPGTPTLTDNLAGGGNVYSLNTDKPADTGNNQSQVAFYTIATKSGTPTCTFTPNGGTGFPFCFTFYEHFTGSDASSVLHKHAGQFQNNPGAGTNAITSTTQATTVAGCLVAGCSQKSTGTLPNLIKGTSQSFADGQNFNNVIGAQSEWVGLAGTATVGATFSDSNGAAANYETIMLVFTPAALVGGGGPPVWYPPAAPWVAHRAQWPRALTWGAQLGVATSFTVGSGSYALSGQPATLLVARAFTASLGTYTLTGPAATLLVTQPSSAGTYTISGQPLTLTVQRALTAAPGSYVISGKAASTSAAKLVTASPGSYTIGGVATTLVVGMPAVTGTYALTGAPTTLLQARVVTGAPGSYTINGAAATLTYTPAGSVAYTLSANAGSYALSGADATLQAQISAPAEVKGGGGNVLKPRKARKGRKPKSVPVEQLVERGPEFSNTPFIFPKSLPAAMPAAVPVSVPVAPRVPAPVVVERAPLPEPDRTPLPAVRSLPDRPTAPVYRAPEPWADPDTITDDEVEAIAMALVLEDVL